MKEKSKNVKLKIQEGKKKTVLADSKIGSKTVNSLLPRGFYSLQTLAEKYGYSKDYIGWLSRTNRIKAMRYGKHGRWYASAVSLKKYTTHLAEANAKRYSAQSA